MKETCCGCFSLRTGGLVIVYIGLFGVVFATLTSMGAIASGAQDPMLVQDGYGVSRRSGVYGTLKMISGLAAIATHLLCAYGIHNDRPSFMLLYLVLNWIAIALIAAFLVLILGVVLIALLISVNTSTEDKKLQQAAGYFGLPIAIVWFVFAFAAAIDTYLTMVVHRLYRYIKDTAHHALPTTEKAYFFRTG